MKKQVATTIEIRDVRRLERLVKADESHTAHILRKAISRGLASLEKDVFGEQADKKNEVPA
jgi:hypothetical protein